MAHRATSRAEPREPEVLPHPPEELTGTKLRRLGEGIGKVVYASEHWVVKRERPPGEIVALIVLWKLLRRFERVLPGKLTHNLLKRPSKQLRVLRLFVQAGMKVLPRQLWFTTHVSEVWRMYHGSSVRGEQLARERLAGTPLVPRRIVFPTTRLRIAGWPGWVMACEAAERVDSTLHQKLTRLAREGRWDEVELWLDRFLETRQRGWRRGLFSTDAHLKNFGVCGDRVLLLDTGGLTDRWEEVEDRLEREQAVEQPHVRLGLESILEPRPDIAERFNARWKAVVSPAVVGQYWS